MIPARHLVPRSVPRTFVVTTPFPADDGSAGYPRGTSVSKAWDKAATSAAIEVANHIVANIDNLANTRSDAADRRDRVKEFCRRFAERAFRRPLSDEQRRFFVDAQFTEATELDSAVKLVDAVDPQVAAVSCIPRFTTARSTTTTSPRGCRLHFGIRCPTRAAGSRGGRRAENAATRLTAHAERMLANPRAKAKVRDFFHHWLPIDEAEDISKDPEALPGLRRAARCRPAHVARAVHRRRRLEREVGLSRACCCADYLLLNDRLAKFYGARSPRRRRVPPGRARCQSNAPASSRTRYLLAAFAYHKSSSPIHRGVFATRKLLGRTLKPPPAAIQFMDGDFDPHLTMREKVAELTKSAACQSLPQRDQPAGLQPGELRRRRPISEPRTRAGRSTPPASTNRSPARRSGSAGAHDLAELAAASPDAHAAFVEQLFRAHRQAALRRLRPRNRTTT